MEKLDALKSRPRKRPDWANMMKEVESGKKLRHVKCNDRSAPLIERVNKITADPAGNRRILLDFCQSHQTSQIYFLCKRSVFSLKREIIVQKNVLRKTFLSSAFFVVHVIE